MLKLTESEARAYLSLQGASPASFVLVSKANGTFSSGSKNNHESSHEYVPIYRYEVHDYYPTTKIQKFQTLSEVQKFTKAPMRRLIDAFVLSESITKITLGRWTVKKSLT